MSFDNAKQTLIFKSDAIEKKFTYKTLRLACKCALCVDEYTGEQKFHEKDLDQNISIIEVFPVGHYGQGIKWLEHGKEHNSMYQNTMLMQS